MVPPRGSPICHRKIVQQLIYTEVVYVYILDYADQRLNTMRASLKSAVLFFTMAMLPCAIFAQQSQPQSQQPESQEPLETLKVNVNVVTVYFNVKGKHGALIPNLTKNDFVVTEDGKPQTIKYFAAESNQPLTLGLMIDTSGSQQNVLGMEQDAGAEFLNQVLTPKDLAFLIGFDINVDLLQDFTSSGRDLRAALRKTRINTGGGGGAAGIPGLGQGPVPVSRPKGTLLYDAIYLAAHDKLREQVGRKAMIILTDGQDEGSQENLPEAIEAAQKADAMCYVILIADRGFYSQGGFYGGDSAMRRLAEETGGRVINVGNKPEKLRAAFDEISKELRTQYMIGYTPTNQTADGTYRKVDVRTVDKEYKVQARKGYYAPGPKQ